MANGPAPTSVSTPEVRVGKAFEADEFPVPAIAFEIESLVEDPVRVRIIDRIPDPFPMEGIGFHPDYDSDNWTAYRDNRVEYERVLDPGETVITVYGIRIDDPEEAEAFLGEPTVETDPVGTDTPSSSGTDEDVLGRETTQVVRNALSGEDGGDGPSGLSAGSLLDDAPEPRGLAPNPTVVLGAAGGDLERMPVDDAGGDVSEDEMAAEDEASEEEDEGDEGRPSHEVSRAADPRRTPGETEPVAERVSVADDIPAETADEGGEATADGTADEEPTESTADGATGAVPGSVAATLASELRDGTVDDDDVAVLRDHLQAETATSVDARIQRLQSRVEDVLAYRDALAEFLDEQGTAEAVLDDIDEIRSRVESLDDRVAAAAAERDDLAARFEEDVDPALADIDERLDRLETDLNERMDALEADIADIHAELEALQEFRDRLSSAFGPDET